MHPAYLETRFWVSRLPSRWPDRFAVITGFATTGEIWSEEKNQAADSALQAELVALSIWSCRVTGVSPDGRHREPGWAADIDLSAAQNIGAAFKQDAIYWVDGDNLSVVSCRPGKPGVLIGSFRQRLHCTATC
jgi:hypothetical protein